MPCFEPHEIHSFAFGNSLLSALKRHPERPSGQPDHHAARPGELQGWSIFNKTSARAFPAVVHPERQRSAWRGEEGRLCLAPRVVRSRGDRAGGTRGVTALGGALREGDTDGVREPRPRTGIGIHRRETRPEPRPGGDVGKGSGSPGPVRVSGRGSRPPSGPGVAAASRPPGPAPSL